MVNVVREGDEVVGTNAEKKPPEASGWQGRAKDDWVTVWF
jgi:hypothetical protein